MKFTAFTFAFLLASSVSVGADQKPTTTRAYDKQGHYVGKSETRGDTTRLYDKNGHHQGKKVTKGNTTELYDRQGHAQGKTVSR